MSQLDLCVVFLGGERKESATQHPRRLPRPDTEVRRNIIRAPGYAVRVVSFYSRKTRRQWGGGWANSGSWPCLYFEWPNVAGGREGKWRTQIYGADKIRPNIFETRSGATFSMGRGWDFWGGGWITANSARIFPRNWRGPSPYLPSRYRLVGFQFEKTQNTYVMYVRVLSIVSFNYGRVEVCLGKIVCVCVCGKLTMTAFILKSIKFFTSAAISLISSRPSLRATSTPNTWYFWNNCIIN